MPNKNKRTAKWTLIISFVFFMLVATGTAYAQDPDSSAVVPNDLNEVAARMMPLLVGAALIERTIEYIFNWTERAILDVGHRLHGIITNLTGLVSVDAKQAWERVQELTNALVKRESLSDDPAAGDETSAFPEEWPLAKLEAQLAQAQKTLTTAENAVQKTLKSPSYVARKVSAASTLAIVLGVLLALFADLRLFEPLGVTVADSAQSTFDTIDLILAGVLMGLGTDWVHQVIGLVIKGKGLLGRAAGGEGGSTVDLAALQQYTDAIVKAQVDAQVKILQDQAEARLDEITGGKLDDLKDIVDNAGG